jgi:hypothetical protein
MKHKLMVVVVTEGEEEANGRIIHTGDQPEAVVGPLGLGGTKKRKCVQRPPATTKKSKLEEHVKKSESEGGKRGAS